MPCHQPTGYPELQWEHREENKAVLVGAGGVRRRRLTSEQGRALAWPFHGEQEERVCHGETVQEGENEIPGALSLWESRVTLCSQSGTVHFRKSSEMRYRKERQIWRVSGTETHTAVRVFKKTENQK